MGIILIFTHVHTLTVASCIQKKNMMKSSTVTVKRTTSLVNHERKQRGTQEFDEDRRRYFDIFT